MDDPSEDADGGTGASPSEPAAEPRPPDGDRLVRMGLVLYGLLLVAAVVWRVGIYGEPLLYASADAETAGLSPVLDVLVGLAVGGVLLGLSDWLTRATDWGERLARELGAALGPLSVPNALLLAAASGLAEEAFFRGALQPRVGWLAASVLFGLAHFVPRRGLWPWTGFAILAGLAFAFLFAWTGNLVAPICAHVLVNAVNLPLLARRYGVPAAAANGDRPSPDA